MTAVLWYREFVPPNNGANLTGVDAIFAEIKIAEGTRKLNLARHGVKISDKRVVETDGKIATYNLHRDAMIICRSYQNKGDNFTARCGDCPVFKVKNLSCHAPNHPFHKMANGTDPEPYIELLGEAVLIA